MAALRDELTADIQSLRAFMIRKIWCTASTEKNTQAIESFDVESLHKLILNDETNSEIWRYFLSFYHLKDQRYYHHDQQKNIYALIQQLKSVIEGQPCNHKKFLKSFQALNITPSKINDIEIRLPDEVAEEVIPEPEVIAPVVMDPQNYHALPIDVLQKLILDINAAGTLPNQALQIITPYQEALDHLYPNKDTTPQALVDTSEYNQIVAIIQIVDFFSISHQLNNYAVTDNFNHDLQYRYRSLAQKNFFDAITQLKENPKDSAKYIKDINDIANAALSRLVIPIDEHTQKVLLHFTHDQSIDNAKKVLTTLHEQLLETNEIQSSDAVELPADESSTAQVALETPQPEPSVSHKKHPYYLEGSFEPTMKECPEYDDDLIVELKASFLEEAQDEIFPLIETAVANLRSNPYQESDILDLRRAFHTLKGSGYTASLPVIGEIGWQVERVINGVRDKHYPFSEAILYHALDGYEAISERIQTPDIQNNELQRIAYQAEYLIKHGGIVDPEDVAVVVASDTTKDVEDHPIDFETFAEIPESYVSPYHLKGHAKPSITEVTTLDADLVAELKHSMFDEAKRELMPALNLLSASLIKDAVTHNELESLRRIYHTLKGNALMVGYNALGEIASTLEKIFDGILSGSYMLTPAITSHASEAYKAIETMLDDQSVPDTELSRLFYQGNALKNHSGNIDTLLIEQKNNPTEEISIESTPISTPEDTLLEKRQAMFENIQSVIEQSEKSTLDQKLTEEILDITDEELSQKLITAFTRCESRTYSTLKRYSQELGLCLLHPNFSKEFPLHHLLISAYHKHLLLFRAHGLTPDDERLILWGKVLTAILSIIKTNNIDEELAYDYIQVLQRPILRMEEEVQTQPIQNKTQEEAIDPELMQAFVEEAHEVLEHADEIIQSWQSENYNPQSPLIAELRRQMHTLKGGARMVGKDGLGELSHALESLLDPNYITLFDSDPTRFEVLQRALDHLQVLLESANKQLDREGFNLLSALHLLLGHENPPELTIEGHVTGESTATEVTDKTATAAQSELSTLKISPMQLNRISEKVSENNILSTQYNNSISNIVSSLGELTRTMQYLNMTARNIEIETEAQMISRHAKASQNKEDFDPLELDQFSELQHLARSISESIEDLNAFHKYIADNVELMNGSLSKFTGNQNLISDTITDIGTVSFTHILPRLRRIVRQVSKSNDKQVELVAIGVDTQVERVVLEQMTAAFEHMIRNSIVHGIETPEERLAKGKPANGMITLKVSKTGSDLLIELSDDGRGFNVEQIRQKAIEKGLIDTNTVISDNELVNLTMLPGFTTATHLSQDAGRGVGLDVLTKAMVILKGTANLSFIPDAGVTFNITIPATLMIVQSLIVNAGGQKYAIPIDKIIGVTQEKDVIFDDRHTQFAYHNDIYEVYHLDKIYAHAALLNNNYIYLLFEAEGRLIAVGADSIVSQLEVIMYPLNPQIANIPGLTGSAVTPDGETIFTVDIAAFTQKSLHDTSKKSKILESELAAVEEQHQPLVMVIDDSITMRRVSQRMLEKAGYKVVLAKDGLDALDILETTQPDIITLDIEMPRMDGFEVLTHLRNTERFMKTPVIMVTSRSGEKHRTRAFEIGANEYCGKPYREEQLLNIIHELLEDSTKQ